MTHSISFMSNCSPTPYAWYSQSSSPSLSRTPLYYSIHPEAWSQSSCSESSTTPYSCLQPRCRRKDVVIQQLLTWRKQNFICVCVHSTGQTVCTLQHRTNNIFQRRWFCFSFCGPFEYCWASGIGGHALLLLALQQGSPWLREWRQRLGET